MKPGSLTRRPKDPLLSPSQGNLVNKIYLQLHVMDCGSYIGVKLLEHSMKIIERVLEKRIRALVDFDEAGWFRTWKGNNGCLILSTKVARRTLNERQKNVHVFC